MDISLINSQSLLQLLSLVEKKEQLLQVLQEIDASIIGTLKGGTVSVEILEVSKKPAPAALPPAPTAAKAAAAAKSPGKPTKKPKAGRPGGLKDRILALLDAAGPEGLRVKDIAAKLGVKGTNVSVWFSTTGKKLTTKIEPGRFAAKGVKPAQAPSVKTEEPAKQAVAGIPAKAEVDAKPAKKKSKMSPEGRARIGAAAKARWAARRAGKPAPAAAAAKPVVSKPTVVKPALSKPVAAKKKGGITPEGRAKIAAASKARWAKVRAGKADKKSTKA